MLCIRNLQSYALFSLKIIIMLLNLFMVIEVEPHFKGGIFLIITVLSFLGVIGSPKFSTSYN